MSESRHWLAEDVSGRWTSGALVLRSETQAEEYRALDGYEVTGPFVPEDREQETLRNLWRLSQGDRMIIRIAGELQELVIEALGVEDATEAERVLFVEQS